MKRTPIVVVAVAVLIGYGAVAWLGITVVLQGSQLRSLEARLGSPAAVVTSSPAASPSTGSSPAPSTSPVPSFPASPTTSAFAQLTKVTDNQGHSWVNHVPGQLVVEEPAGATVIFTTVAQDPLNRTIEYAYSIGGPPAGVLTILCNWGGAICTWTTPVEPITIVVTAYVRTKNTPGQTQCAIGVKLGACDDQLTFFVYLVIS